MLNIKISNITVIIQIKVNLSWKNATFIDLCFVMLRIICNGHILKTPDGELIKLENAWSEFVTINIPKPGICYQLNLPHPLNWEKL